MYNLTLCSIDWHTLMTERLFFIRLTTALQLSRNDYNPRQYIEPTITIRDIYIEFVISEAYAGLATEDINCLHGSGILQQQQCRRHLKCISFVVVQCQDDQDLCLQKKKSIVFAKFSHIHCVHRTLLSNILQSSFLRCIE